MTIARVLELCLLAAALSPGTPAASDPPGQAERLRAGEIVSVETSSADGGAAGRMQVLIRAPARAVWDVIVSCQLAFTFVEGLRSCEVLEDSGDRAVVRQEVDKGWLLPVYDYVFESLRRPYERIDVRLLEGNLKALEGYWVFRETGDGTLVDYRIHIRPSLPAPRFLVRRSINKGMPDMLACIRGLAAGSGSAELGERDLGRCPGGLPASPPAQ